MKKELAELLNKQINFELYSAHIYLNMACYCKAQGLEGFAKWMDIQYQEEIGHAKRIINHLVDCGFTPTISNWEDSPASDYASILEVAQISLLHEKVVTDRFNYMMTKANELEDYATMNFLNWFINEQVEEEANFEAMIQKINLVKDAGLYLLDQEYASRVLSEENNDL